MHGIKIPQQYFVLHPCTKCKGGGGAMCEGGVFVGHYGRLIATTHALHVYTASTRISVVVTNKYLLEWHCIYLLYSRKLSREKTFANFVDLWLFTKVFAVKFGGVVSFSMARASNPRKFSPQKSFFVSSLPQNFPTIQ